MMGQPPKGAPDASAPPAFVHGSAALDMSVAPAARSHLPGTLTGRTTTQFSPGSSARAVRRTSRRPLLLGGALGLLVVGGLGVSFLLWTRSQPAPAPASPSPTPDAARAQVGALTQALVETQLKLAARDLDDKNYAGAIEQADRILKLDGQNAQARHIRGQASAKKEEVAATATEAQQAADAGDSEKASLALARLLELDPGHPAAAALSERLNSAFKTRAEDAGRSMARSRGDAEAARAARSETFTKAEATAREAEARLQQGDYAEATRSFLEARDGFDRARRAAKPPSRVGPGPSPGATSPPGTSATAAQPSAAPAPVEPAPPTRAFVTGKTTIGSARGGGDIQGFDSADVKTRRVPDLAGHIEFETEPAALEPGRAFSVRVFVVNEGKKPVRIRGVALTVISNGRRSALNGSPLARDVAPLQRAAVAEAKAVWPDGTFDWGLDAVVTSDRDETAQCRLTWQ
jgi:cytoskeletal protein RodZ